MRAPGWLDLRVDLRALAAGVAADWLGTLLTAGLLGVAFGVGPDTPDSRIQALLTAPEFIISATVHGAFFTALGGYVAARLAPEDPLRHAVIVGALSLVLAVLLSTAPGEGPAAPWWVVALGYLLVVPAAAAGGWLGSRRLHSE
jgi:uncharacterized membrane protein HdeD (DUF308 family)